MNNWRVVLSWQVEERPRKEFDSTGYWIGGHDKSGFVRHIIKFYGNDFNRGERFFGVLETANDLDAKGYFSREELRECARKAYDVLRSLHE